MTFYQLIFFIGVIVFGAIVAFAIVFAHAKYFAKQRVELVTDWRTYFKRWSTWLSLTGVGLFGYFLQFPDEMIRLWAMMPDEWKSALPPQMVKALPFAFIAAATLVTNIKQQRLVRQQLQKPLPQSVTVSEDGPMRKAISRNFIGNRNE